MSILYCAMEWNELGLSARWSYMYKYKEHFSENIFKTVVHEKWLSKRFVLLLLLLLFFFSDSNIVQKANNDFISYDGDGGGGYKCVQNIFVIFLTIDAKVHGKMPFKGVFLFSCFNIHTVQKAENLSDLGIGLCVEYAYFIFYYSCLSSTERAQTNEHRTQCDHRSCHSV